MSTWTIAGRILGTFQTVSFADLGLQKAKRGLANLAPDLFSVTQVAGYDGQPLFTYDQPYLVALDGEPRFYGRRLKMGRQGTGQESVTYNFACPYNDLKRLPYQQSWKFGDTTKLLTRIVFFVDENGNRTNTYYTLQEVLSFAVSNGVPIQIGDFSYLDEANILPNQFEARSPMCHEVIQKCIYYSPEMMQWLDYRTTVLDGAGNLLQAPTFNLTPRSAAPAVTFSMATAPFAGAKLVPREDLVPRGWVVNYVSASLTETSPDGDAEMVVRQDVADTGVTSGIAVPIDTYDLQPGSSNTTFLDQKIETVPIPPDFTLVDPDAANNALWWWQLKFPFLLKEDQYKLDAVVIENPTTDVDIGTFNSGEAAEPMTRELTVGSIQDWMLTGFGTKFYRGKVIAKLRITFTDPGTTLEHKHTLPVSIPMTTTNTLLTEFKKQGSSSGETPEQPPDMNLAQWLYDQWSVLHYEGDINLMAQEANHGAHPGTVVNITGGTAEWSTMGAQIQQVDEDIDSGRTTLRVGPPEHLAASDMKEMMTPSRYSWQSGSKDKGSASRQDAATQKGGSSIPGAQGLPATGTAGGGMVPEQMHVADPDGAGDNVISLYSNKDDLEMTIAQWMRDDCYGELRVDSNGESSIWLYNADGAGVNIKLSCKDGQITIYDEATGNTCYMKPGSLVVTSADDTVYGEFKADASAGFSFWGYADDGSGNQVKYDTTSGKLVVWNESSGATVEAQPGSVTISDADGSFVTLTKNSIQGVDGATGNELDIPLASLPTGASYLSPIEIDVCQDGEPKKMTVIASAPYSPS